MNKRVIIIGSGFSGLSAACYLSKYGFDVTVLEKNSTPGGRARQLQAEGFTFDMGPSWYWMPDIFEQFFATFGKRPSDYYQLVRLDPSYRVRFRDQILDIPADMEALQALFESIEPGAGKELQKFLGEAQKKYEVAMKHLGKMPGLSISELLQPDLIFGILRLDIFSSIARNIRKHFRNEKLIQLLEFPILFLGSTPEKTPSLYSLMNYADMALGTWYPMGGMHQVVRAMVTLAESLGVRFQFNEEVKSLVIENDKAKKVITTNGECDAEIVVCSADYHHFDQTILPPQYRNYSSRYWDKRVLAPSSLLFYMGINKKLTNLKHHVLFFDEDFKQHAREIYDQPAWPSRPLLYASATSLTDPVVAPAGHENLVVLIPVAPGLEDTEEIREQYYKQTMRKLETLTGSAIEKHVVYRKGYAHRDFIRDYHSFKGNAYGLANTLMQTAHLKPSILNRKIRNLYFCGQLTVPGPGVPPSLISGAMVAGEIRKNFK